MAENQEGRSQEDLTEEASPYRLEEFRRKGQVAQSRELTGLLALLAAGAVLAVTLPSMGRDIGAYMQEIFRTDLSGKLDLSSQQWVAMQLMKSLKLIALAALPICLAGFLIGILGSFSQIGAIFTSEPLSFDLKKIDPLSGLQRLLSKKHGIEAVRLSIKVTVVLFVSYLLIRTEIFSSGNAAGQEASSFLVRLSETAKEIFFALLAVLGVFSLIDFALQKWEYSKSVRLTKQEAKEEHKEREGDPQIKARIRAIQREVARKRMMAAVKKADVVITNPTHIAIAIQYDREKMFAPKVVAKGADLIAQKIKSIARETGVPMVENVPLARTLYRTVKLNQAIPKALYQAVAEVLAFVYRLKGRVKA